MSRIPKGQSLVEAIVAITIIVTSVTSALTLVQSSITSSRLSGSQIIASNLAREGLETVRAIRDSNWLQGNSFSVGLSHASQTTALARFNSSSASWSMAFAALTFSSTATPLLLTAQGLYQHPDDAPVGSVNTPYKRIITIGRICRNNGTGVERIESTPAGICTAVTETWVGLAVNSQVQYQSIGTSVRTLSVEERLYDWR